MLFTRSFQIQWVTQDKSDPGFAVTVFLSLARQTAQREEKKSKKEHRFWLCTKTILLIEAYLKT